MTFVVSDSNQLDLALSTGDLDAVLRIIPRYQHHLLSGPLVASRAEMLSNNPRVLEGVGVMQLCNVLKEHARNEYDVTSVQLSHCIQGRRGDLARFRCASGDVGVGWGAGAGGGRS